ncbi:MAG: RecX family transcriptional regulator [Sphingomicrobium sp.]
MRPPRDRPRVRKELDEQALGALALRYVERFATTRHKLAVYLQRKIRERGWSGDRAPDLAALAERFADHGYVDDAAFALAKARSLTGRGYGRRRVSDTLRVAGVDEADAAAARDLADEHKVSAALRFAERRGIGPFATAAPADPKARDKAIGAMLRAGHGFALARAIVALAPGDAFDPEELSQID